MTTPNHYSGLAAGQQPPRLFIKLAGAKSLQKNNFRTSPIFTLVLKICFWMGPRCWHVACNRAGAKVLHMWFGAWLSWDESLESEGKGSTWSELPHLVPLSPSLFVFFLQRRWCFHLPSQFLSSSLLSSPSPEYLVWNINNLKIRLSISYFELWHRQGDIIAISKIFHWMFSIHPFKFSYLFLPVNVLHNSLSLAIQSICLSSICPDNNSTAYSFSFSSIILIPYAVPHLWNSNSRTCYQLFFKFFFKDSFYPSENQRHLLSFIYTWTLQFYSTVLLINLWMTVLFYCCNLILPFPTPASCLIFTFYPLKGSPCMVCYYNNKY